MRHRKHTSTKAESAFAADSRLVFLMTRQPGGFHVDTSVLGLGGKSRQGKPLATPAVNHPPPAGLCSVSVASRPQKDRTMDQYILYIYIQVYGPNGLLGTGSPGRLQRPYGLLVTGQPRTSTETAWTIRDWLGTQNERPYGLLGTGSP